MPIRDAGGDDVCRPTFYILICTVALALPDGHQPQHYQIGGTNELPSST